MAEQDVGDKREKNPTTKTKSRAKVEYIRSSQTATSFPR